ncbi:MAG TPA: hypothetical protein VK507_13440 [Iamia sp.]|nr:hypothetical protein [Iamia sp.]
MDLLPTNLTVRPSGRYAGRGTEPGQPTTGYLRFWAPLLGPTATLAYRHLLDATSDGTSCGYINTGHLAHDLGIGRGRGRDSTLVRTLRRLERYGLIDEAPQADTIALAIHLPWLGRHQLDRLRPDLAHLERLCRQATEATSVVDPRLEG